MIRRRAKTRRSSRVRDVAHMLRVKELPCCLAGNWMAGDCEGVVEADHVGPRGLSQKSDDTSTIPLCTRHHRDRTDFSGWFAAFTRDRMRTWCSDRLAETRLALALLLQ